jgi:hypothetical protein
MLPFSDLGGISSYKIEFLYYIYWFKPPFLKRFRLVCVNKTGIICGKKLYVERERQLEGRLL